MCNEVYYVSKEDLLWEDGEYMATVIREKPRYPYLVIKMEYDPDSEPGTRCGTICVCEPTIIGAIKLLAKEDYILPMNGIAGVNCSILAKARKALLADPKTQDFIRKHDIFILNAS